MKVRLRKQIHSSSASVSTRDVWVDKVIDIPMVSLVGLTIESDAGLFERVDEVLYNITTGEIIAYVEEDNTFSDVKKPMENFADTPEFKALVQTYLNQDWEISGGIVMDTNEEFKQEIFGIYPRTEAETKLLDLAQEYHDRTERFDRVVCTGPIRDGSIMPANGQERSLINKHAREVRDEIYHETLMLGFAREQIKEAITNYRRRT